MKFLKPVVLLPIIAMFFLGVGAAFAQSSGVDLQLTKAVDNPNPLEGELVTYTLTVLNNGSDPASGVAVTDVIPEGVTFSSNDDPTHGSVTAPTAEDATLVWDLGDVEGGATAVLQFVATVDEGTYGQTITNTASVSAVNEADSDSSNDADSADITVPAVDLEVSKTVDIAAPIEGELVTYSIVVTNQGLNEATGVQVTDPLPTGMTFSELGTASQGSAAGTDSVVWDVGALASGASASLEVEVSVDADTSGDTITNTASVSAVDQTDSNSENNASSVDITVGAVDLQIVKSVDNPTPNEGDTVTYTLVISNDSGNDASGIAVTDTLPTGVTFAALITPSAGTATTPTTGAETSVLWEVDSLLASSNASLGIEVSVDSGTAGQTITNTATIVQSDQVDETISTQSDQVDAATVNHTSSVDIVVGGVVEELPPEGKRKAFVGIVLDEPGNSVTISKQGTGERITILLTEPYELKTPGGPDRADSFALGARVVIQVRLVGEDWVAIRVLVKPRKPNLPLTGVVLSVENGVVTITLPDGTTQTLDLPEGFEDLTAGELITAFPGNSGNAKGVVKAGKIRDRLEKFLDKLTQDETEPADEAEAEIQSKRVANLIRVLEKHSERQIGIMDEVLDRVPEHAREKLERAKENVEKGRARAIEAIGRAKDRFGDDITDQHPGRSDKGNRGRGRGNSPDGDEGEDPDSTPLLPGQGKGPKNDDAGSAGKGGGRDNDRGNRGGKDKDRGGKGKN
ncbi:MAG: hypothetical protein ACE5Q6_05395 [Dehalococcoidia bacterium]